MQILLILNIFGLILFLCILQGSSAFKILIQISMYGLLGANTFYLLKISGYIFQLPN